MRFSFHTRYHLILYEYSNVEGFDLIDVERVFNHEYFNLSEIYLKVYFIDQNNYNGEFDRQ